jgi:hypothetical protein
MFHEHSFVLVRAVCAICSLRTSHSGRRYSKANATAA